MNSAADEDDVDHFLNTSSRILDEYDRGIDVSEDVRLLELPSECTPGICKIYTEIKNLLPVDEAPVHRLSLQDTVRPETPSHRRCVHYVAPPPQNTGLQLRDFLYLFICLTFGCIVYRLMKYFNYNETTIVGIANLYLGVKRLAWNFGHVDVIQKPLAAVTKGGRFRWDADDPRAKAAKTGARDISCRSDKATQQRVPREARLRVRRALCDRRSGGGHPHRRSPQGGGPPPAGNCTIPLTAQ